MARQPDSPPASPSPHSDAPRRILVLLPRQLGDILLGLPLARAIKERWPGARVSWYAHPMGRLLLEDHPWVDELLTYPVEKKARGPLARPLAALRLARREIAFALSLRGKDFDVVVDAMANPRTALTSFLTGAPLRVSFRTRFPRDFAFHVLVPRARLASGYVGRARLSLLGPLGFPPPEEMPCGSSLPLRPEERARVEGWLIDEGLAERAADGAVSKPVPFVVVAPAHRHAVRKWPGEKFVALSRALHAELGLRVVWLWGPGEEAEVRGLHVALGAASHFPPLLTLRETAFLAGLSRGFVGNSNGLSHVCVAGGARSVQLHGPTSPENWTLPDPARHRGVQRNTGCVRCERNTCSLARRECLDDLAVDDVLAACRAVLA